MFDLFFFIVRRHGVYNQQFYAGLVIFITGGTGFLGKQQLLLLKLLVVPGNWGHNYVLENEVWTETV